MQKSHVRELTAKLKQLLIWKYNLDKKRWIFFSHLKMVNTFLMTKKQGFVANKNIDNSVIFFYFNFVDIVGQNLVIARQLFFNMFSKFILQITNCKIALKLKCNKTYKQKMVKEILNPSLIVCVKCRLNTCARSINVSYVYQLKTIPWLKTNTLLFYLQLQQHIHIENT